MISLQWDLLCFIFNGDNRELAQKIYNLLIKQKKRRSKTTEIDLLIENSGVITTQGVKIKNHY